MNLKSVLLIMLIVVSTLSIIETVARQSGTTQPREEIVQKDNCDNPLSQTAMNICANLEYQEVDAKLNEIYQQVKRAITSDLQEQKLIKTQLSWLEFRDLNCNYVADAYRGGSIQPLIYYSCLTSLTEERIQHLAQMVANF